MKKLFYVILFISTLQSLPAQGQTASIPDPIFLSFLKSNYPATINASNQLIISKAAEVTGSLVCKQLDITSLEGIQYFTGITMLDADDNLLTNVSQVSGLTALQTLRLENNQITTLPSLSNLTNLRVLAAYDNQLQSLPDLSNNTQLRQLTLYNNQITSLPDLTSLVNLLRIDLGNNKLSVTPDVSSNVLLTQLSLDRNFLTEAPDLSNLNNLNEVQLHANYFSFGDLLPYISHPDFSIFEISPQKVFPVNNIEPIENNTLILSTGIDASISNVTYTWYHNSSLVGSVTKDSLIINPVTNSHQGNYYSVLTHPSFPGLQLTTAILNVDVITCPSISDFSFEYGNINCIETGTLKVNLTSLPTQVYTFYLSSPITGDTLTSNTGFFEGLTQPMYSLSVKSGALCQVAFPDPLNIPFEECKEVFITPDGDGDKDSHYFSQFGSAVIYDKSGKVVQTLTIPGEWAGSSKTSSLVAPGYYVADINQGEAIINISVLY